MNHTQWIEGSFEIQVESPYSLSYVACCVFILKRLSLMRVAYGARMETRQDAKYTQYNLEFRAGHYLRLF